MMEESATKSFKENNMFKDLTDLKTEKSVKEFIDRYGKNWVWKPIGGRENAGIIDMGSEPSDALAERMTNGIDALIEKKYLELGTPSVTPKSPKESTEKWFKIPYGNLSKLNENERRKLAENLIISLLESGESNEKHFEQWTSARFSPTVEVKDKGVGKHPDRFEKTFLSLNENNKMGKHFLMGAFGQGGSIVYGFVNYTIIISRRPKKLLENKRSDFIGWTIIRKNERNYEKYKKAIYEYCVSPEGFVMRFSPQVSEDFEGSIVRSIEFDLPKESTIYGAPSGSLWWLSHHCLFDPVLPFLICDKRNKRFPSLTEGDMIKGKVINGNRFRLNAKDKNGHKKYKSNSWKISLSNLNAGDIEVIWWVCEDKKELDNFINRSQPIVVTFNGQRQILITKAELSLKGRDFVKDRLIVQVIGDYLSSSGQRIFSSTRDGARKNKVYLELVNRLKKALTDDEELKILDEELKEKILSKETSEQEKKANKLLEKLLDRQEKLKKKSGKILSDDFNFPLAPTKRIKKDKNDLEEDEETNKEELNPPPKIELNKIPTKIEILNKILPIKIEKGKGVLLRIFVNATNDYFTKEENGEELKIDFKQKGLLVERARSNLREGRVDIRLEATPESSEDSICESEIFITRPNNLPLTAEVSFRILKAKKRLRLKSGKKEKTKPKGPIIKLVGEESWKELGWDETDVAEFKNNIVFVNKQNRYVSACLKSIKSEETLKRYLARYGAHIALFTILQKKFEEKLGKDLPPEYIKNEMERAARSLIYAVAINIEELESSL